MKSPSSLNVDEMEKNLNLASEDMDMINLKIEESKRERDDEFVFTSKQGSSFLQFKTPPLKTNLFGDAHDKFKFSAKKEQSGNTRMNKSRAKPKFSAPFPGHDLVLKAKMDGIGNTTPTDQCLNKNECEVVGAETKEEASECKDTDDPNGGGDDDDDPNDETETGSLKSGNDEVDMTDDGDGMSQLGCDSGSRNMSGFGFTFSAEVQSSGLKRHPKKKNLVKVGHGHHDTYNYTPNSLSSVTCSPFSGTSSLVTLSGQGQKAKVSSRGSEVNKEQRIKEELASISATTIAAEEACEKWRLKGNQAYKNGNLSVAEDCYTRGVSCASKEEASQRYRMALMLCYSNRAATRMSLGRMRDAVADCMLAAEIDPNFLRVRLRAANCFLALGEVGDASKYSKKCMQSGTDVCVDQKIAVEASDLLQKTQKVAELINHSDELLQRRTDADAERALEHINEALMISLYSEKLLEMKAEALFMLCRYEEVIQLCDETFGSAEKNSYPLNADCKVTDLDSSQLSKGFYFRLWRCSMMLKSYFHLGKLEEGLSLLKEQEEKVSAINKSESKVLESLIPLSVTVRELLHYKTAGNEEFQAGRHEEAVEHYTAALSCNVESRPFAAVCFGNRAAAYKALGQITDAIADCNLAIALDGRYLKALSRRATLYEMIRDYDQAASDIRRVVSLIIKGDEDNSNQRGISDRSISYANDLKHNQIWLSEIEEEARKGIPLDMYLILGVEHSVSSSEIKKAYHKAALRHHPDKAGQSLARSDSGDDQKWKDIVEEVCKDADRLFKIIGEAYAVLSDPAKRLQYDSEEEMRNSMKKRHGNSMARNNVNTQYYPFDQTDSRRQWKEVWRSCDNSSYKDSEAGRSSRH
ncbi:DnaJ-like subfamily C member 7 [Spatholobus suberectus]|nr:DnaJ-like subfamily C member 7 [Spatholobus suberectus]